MSQQWVYTTRRMELIEERAGLAKALKDAVGAMQGLLSGEITSYNLGHYSISRNKIDLDKLQSWINSTRVRIDEIDCLLTGRAKRRISRCVYSNPQNMRWGL